MRLNPEPSWVIETIAQETGADAHLVESVLADVHHVVDRMVANDYTLVLAPLLFRRSGEPVWEKVLTRFTTTDWKEPHGLKALSAEEFAAEIGLDVEVVAAYPVVFAWEVLVEVLQWRGVTTWEDEGVDMIEDIVVAWRSTFDAGDDIDRRYRTSHVGLERDFETWLIEHHDRLEELEYPVEIVGREVRLASGRRLDMLCRFTRDADPNRVGDYLVIENKATAVGIGAHDQLAHYVASVREEIATGDEGVSGLLISDGSTVELQRALTDSGFGYLTLSDLGYRDHLYRQHLLTRDPDTTALTVVATVVGQQDNPIETSSLINLTTPTPELGVTDRIEGWSSKASS